MVVPVVPTQLKAACRNHQDARSLPDRAWPPLNLPPLGQTDLQLMAQSTTYDELSAALGGNSGAGQCKKGRLTNLVSG